MLAFTPKQNIFYPSVGLSAVISSMADLSKAGISFLKVRGSMPRVGNGSRTLHHRSQLHADQRRGEHGDDRSSQAPRSRAYQMRSRPVSTSSSWATRSRLRLPTTIPTPTTSSSFTTHLSSGYKQKYINAGKVNNWGYRGFGRIQEHMARFLVGHDPQLLDEPQQDQGAGSRRHPRSDTGSLVDIKEVNKDYGGYRVKLVEGGSIGDFCVKGLLTDDKGHIYVDPNSNTVLLDPDPEAYIFAGNTEARFRWGWNNQFSYKGVSLGVLIDARIGGRGVSATQALMDRFGVSQDSADARENGGVWISDDQQVPDAKTFYRKTGDGMAMLSHYVCSMTNVRLRELTLGYDLPTPNGSGQQGQYERIVRRPQPVHVLQQGSVLTPK